MDRNYVPYVELTAEQKKAVNDVYELFYPEQLVLIDANQLKPNERGGYYVPMPMAKHEGVLGNYYLNCAIIRKPVNRYGF